MRNRILKAPLAAVIGLLALLAIPAVAQAHTSTAKVACDGKVTIDFTSFASGSNTVHYEIGVNGSATAGSKTFGSSTQVIASTGTQLYNGDRVTVTTWWDASETADHHSQAKKTVLDTTIANCGDKPPPPPPVYDCDGNPLPPGSTPPTPEECNPPVTPPVTPPADTPPADTPPADTPPAGTPPADTPPAASGNVLPEQVVSGRARLRGPSGCVKQAFRARVSGRSISSVTFYVDGKRIKRVAGGSASARINPSRYGFGRHRVVALVRFTAESGTAARRLPLTFRRCAQGAVAPRFTG